IELQVCTDVQLNRVIELDIVNLCSKYRFIPVLIITFILSGLTYGRTAPASHLILESGISPPSINTSGSISGKVYLDSNRNSSKDVSETGLAGSMVRIYGDRTDSTLTDSQGNYSFTGLGDGSYIIGVDIKSGWLQFQPADVTTGKK